MAGSRVMKDSYVGGIVSSSCIQQNDELPFCVTIEDEKQQTTDGISGDKIDSILFGGKTSEWATQTSNQTDEDKIIHLTCPDEAKSTNINKTEEYNVGYSGISILPWEEFAFNPRVFNDLFYTENNSRITYDPDEVNVFFHGKNVMPPTVGDISENGKSWNIDVETVNDLRKVRKMLTERCSVFGVTLVYKEKRFAKPVRAPCLVLLDPSEGGLGDRIYTTLTKAMDTIHNQRRFCVEINLNVCVERWCKSVLLTDCKAVGAKLYVTNGEEYTPLNETTEDIICCALCFPIWLLQTTIYKLYSDRFKGVHHLLREDEFATYRGGVSVHWLNLHRFVTYDDYRSDFDADEIFLHGSFQDAQFQRQQIFKENESGDVFRVRSANQTDIKTLQALGTHKFVCVKKVENVEDVSFFKEHNTASFGALVDKRKERVLHKDKKISVKNTKKSKSQESNVSEVDESKTGRNIECDDNIQTTYANEAFSSSEDENCDTASLPKIPEIASVLCAHDQDESVEVEVSADMEMREGNMFIKMTESLDQDALDLRMQKAECTDEESMPDSKSTTAVRSFQIFDSESETETSEDDEMGQAKTEVSKSKDDLLEEMMKIEMSLPKIQRNTNEVENAPTKESSDSTRKKAKSKKKILVGQAFREITRTTDKPATKTELSDGNGEGNGCKTSLENVKCEKTTSEVKSTENSIDGVNVTAKRPNSSNDTKKIEKTDKMDEHVMKVATQKPVGFDKSDIGHKIPEKQTNKNGSKDEILEFSNSDNAVQESTVSAFNPNDSSSDGDEVEMIYQSKSTKNSLYRNKNLSDKDSNSLKNRHEVSASEIEHIAKANKKTSGKMISSEETRGTILNTNECLESNVEMTTDLTDKADVSVNTNLPNHLKHTHPDSVYGVTKVETAMDITDIDEEGNEEKPNVVIPPLKLNIGEKLGQKAKRINKHYSSNRKYLGASVPSKVKRK